LLNRSAGAVIAEIRLLIWLSIGVALSTAFMPTEKPELAAI
jgi:hypothetical protein